MSKEERLRTNVRLRVGDGIVLLRYGGVPSVACNLLDMSEGGCRCLAPLHALDAAVADAWKRVLGPQRPLNIELTCPPHLRNVPLEVEIRRLDPTAGGGMELGLQFRNVSREQRELLQKVMLFFATDKVRDAFGTSKVIDSAAYLVGASTKGSTTTTRVERGDRARPDVPPAPVSGTRTPAVPSASASRHAAPAGYPALEELSPTEAAAELQSLQAREVAPEPPHAPEAAPEVQAAYGTAGESPLAPPPPPPLAEEEGEPRAADPFRGKRVGEILVHMGKLGDDEIAAAVERSRFSGERLGRYLLREGLIQPDELCRALALQSGLPMTDLQGAEIPESLAHVFPFPMMQRHEFVPFDESRRVLCIAVANPLPADVLEEMERIAQRHIEIFLAQEDLVLLAIDQLRPKEKRNERRHMRYRCEFPVRYQFCNRLGRVVADAECQGRTVDISEGGFSIEGPDPGLGSPEDLRRRGLCVSMTVLIEPQPVKCLCSLRFVKTNEPDSPGAWVLGLQILELAEADKRRLKEACIQAGMRKPGESGPKHELP
ncbi:MAG: PilZ domain-containing protein [Planctomycetes bacterium]|nr:PilZ domain-containing protein [Planctomycetota bacterium]